MGWNESLTIQRSHRRRQIWIATIQNIGARPLNRHVDFHRHPFIHPPNQSHIRVHIAQTTDDDRCLLKLPHPLLRNEESWK